MTTTISTMFRGGSSSKHHLPPHKGITSVTAAADSGTPVVLVEGVDYVLSRQGQHLELTAEVLPVGRLDIEFVPMGNTDATFGSHHGITTEALSGFIEVVDADGVTRKLAVVS